MHRLILTILLSFFTSISSTALADKITASIQRDLNLLGYNAGPVDGVSGRKTISSLEAFYTDYCQAPFICANFKVVVSGIGGRIPRL